jgi:Mn2+/Fe2+ NRAMP family transporter
MTRTLWPLTSRRGGQYGLHLLWVLLILLPVTYFVQETGKGHAAMISLRFGPWSVLVSCAIRTSSTF